MFARRDDINLAYTAANGVVTLMTPQDSTMVVKVGGGHNCWLAEQLRVRRDSHHLDHQLGRRSRLRRPLARSSSSRRCCAILARARTFRPTHGALFLTHGLPVTRGPLLRVPLVGLGAEAAAVLRGRPAERLGGRDGRLRGSQVEDESRRPGDLALRRTSARRVAQLLDASCANDANAMQAAIQSFSNGVQPTVSRPAADHEQSNDALRGHDRLGRQPLRSERHRDLRVQDGARLRHVDHACLLDRLRHERRRSCDGPHPVGQRPMVRRLGAQFRRR